MRRLDAALAFFGRDVGNVILSKRFFFQVRSCQFAGRLPRGEGKAASSRRTPKAGATFGKAFCSSTLIHFGTRAAPKISEKSLPIGVGFS